MEKRKAKKLKIGDRVIGHTTGIHDPMIIVGIIHSHPDAKAKVPLFKLENRDDPITYRLLEPVP